MDYDESRRSSRTIPLRRADRSITARSWIGSRIGEIRWRDFFGRGRSPRGRQARNLQVKRFRFGRGSLQKRWFRAMETKHDSLGFVRVISRPACMHTHSAKGTACTCDWWSSRSPRFNFTGIHRRNDFVSCCGGVLIDFSIIDNASLPTRRSLIAQPLWYSMRYIYIYTWSKFRLWDAEIRICKSDRMCFEFWSLVVQVILY